MEHTNARQLKALPEPVEFVTIDVSFISLDFILHRWFSIGLKGSQAGVIALVKPQFEAGRDIVQRGRVIRDSAVHAQVLEQTMTFAQKLGYSLAGLIRSPLTPVRMAIRSSSFGYALVIIPIPFPFPKRFLKWFRKKMLRESRESLG